VLLGDLLGDNTLSFPFKAVRIALCILYRGDVPGMLGLVTSVPVVPYVITGLIIGRGSNFVHDFAKRWLGTSVLVG
jgi:hypothetical protein